MLFLLRERGKDVIEQGCGGADELAGVSFHGHVLTMLAQGVGHLWGAEASLLAEPSSPSRHLLDRTGMEIKPAEWPTHQHGCQCGQQGVWLGRV